jgi:hypothetical protein
MDMSVWRRRLDMRLESCRFCARSNVFDTGKGSLRCRVIKMQEVAMFQRKMSTYGADRSRNQGLVDFVDPRFASESLPVAPATIHEYPALICVFARSDPLVSQYLGSVIEVHGIVRTRLAR